MGREFGLCVNGSRDRLAVEHLRALKDLKSILLLAQEQALGVGCYVDA